MARMIPPVIHQGCDSPGEIEVFERLRDDPATREWFILHSLDLANHRRQVTGEADFVVIIPGKGVLCLEVKGCRSLQRANGMWYYGTNPKSDAFGPFKQASDSMYSIRDRLLQRKPDLKDVVFYSGVIFPFVEVSTESEEWHRWQLIDGSTFISEPLGEQVEAILDRARVHMDRSKSAKWFNPKSPAPDKGQCEAIASALRPDFESYESPKSRAERSEEELRKYSGEQLGALDSMEKNPRVVFDGAAGTGKTLLAIEAARRSSAAGRKVLFLCYNRLLCEWLQDEVASLNTQVTCDTLHNHMCEVAGIKPGAHEPDFWENELPQSATERLMDMDEEGRRYDELIIDEAQDILREGYLDFLELSLKGGLDDGRWRMFGDFDKQAIYGAADIGLDDFLKDRGRNAPIHSLLINCRNTPGILELTCALDGDELDSGRIRRQDEGMEPELFYFEDSAEQQQLLTDSLGKLYDDGYSGRDIIILSPRRDEACAAVFIDEQPWRDRIKSYRALSQDAKSGDGYIGYCTIQAFKGLEAPVVVITDIDKIHKLSMRALLYIGTTRTLHRLVMLINKTEMDEIKAARAGK